VRCATVVCGLRALHHHAQGRTWANESAAIEADPNNATYYSNRAAAYISANRFYEALEDCKMADELDPDNMKILLRLGRVYTSLGRPDEAVHVYNQINATAKDMQPALSMQKHLRTAEETSRKENGSGSMVIYALNEAEKGLGIGVDKPRKWQLMRGEAHLRMGNPNALGEAQNVVMSILRNNNQDPDALVLRGRILYAQGENDKALQHFRQALSCDPDFKAAVKYLRMVQKLERMKSEGNASFKAGRYQEAVNTYTEALAVDPLNKNTNSKILQNRALCNSRLKQWKAAVADCNKALELDPSYTKARKTRAKALGESGNWEEAVRELKAMYEANPSEPGLAKEIRDAELELKKSKRKDYYKILGLEKDCTETEVKKAYRKLAIVHHPDKNPGDEDAADRFKEIQEAHETLSDPQKRARYDSGEDLVDPSDMFGGGGGGGGFGGAGGIDPEICEYPITVTGEARANVYPSNANVRRRNGRYGRRRPRRWRRLPLRKRWRRQSLWRYGRHARRPTKRSRTSRRLPLLNSSPPIRSHPHLRVNTTARPSPSHFHVRTALGTGTAQAKTSRVLASLAEIFRARSVDQHWKASFILIAGMMACRIIFNTLAKPKRRRADVIYLH
jgi:curved DNA-binding protein CbpA/Tfp pilus assembly protein PilF